MSHDGKTCITLCLGSSCFTRGNAELLPVLQDQLAQRGLADRVHLKGSRCEGQCMHGPNLRIGEVLVHEVKAADLETLLERHL